MSKLLLFDAEGPSLRQAAAAAAAAAASLGYSSHDSSDVEVCCVSLIVCVCVWNYLTQHDISSYCPLFQIRRYVWLAPHRLQLILCNRLKIPLHTYVFHSFTTLLPMYLFLQFRYALWLLATCNLQYDEGCQIQNNLHNVCNSNRWPNLYINAIYDRISVISLPQNTMYTPYIHGLANPIHMWLFIREILL